MNLLEETIVKIELLLLEAPSTPRRRDWLARLAYLRRALVNAELAGNRPAEVLTLGGAILRLLEEIEEVTDSEIARDARGFATHESAVA